MGTYSFSHVKLIPKVYGGCGLRGICCMGGAQMFSVYEEVQGGGPYPQRKFTSPDNGATWSEMASSPFMDPDDIWLWAAYPLGTGIILVGNEGPELGLSNTDAGIVGTNDGGVTWTGRTGTLFNPAVDFWDLEWFFTTADGIVATGGFTSGGSTYFLLLSTNGGTSFGSPKAFIPSAGTLLTIFSGDYAGSNVILLGAQMSNASSRIFRSTTNYAGAFSEIVLPNTQHAHQVGAGSTVKSIISMDGSKILACGDDHASATDFPCKLWRSTDAGANWSEITDSIPGRTAGTKTPGAFLVKLDSLRAVYAVEAKPNDLSGTNFFLTEDAGATWMAQAVSGGYTGGGAVNFKPMYGAVADNGNVALTASWTGDLGVDEIWLGVPTGISVSGICSLFVPPSPIGAGPCDDLAGSNARR